MDKKQIGHLIRVARHEKRWTQQQLADKFGCSQANISDMERGDVSIDLVDLHRLVRVLGKDLYYLFPRNESGLEGAEQAVQILASLPDSSIRNEAIAAILAIARDARRRVSEQRR